MYINFSLPFSTSLGVVGCSKQCLKDAWMAATNICTQITCHPNLLAHTHTYTVCCHSFPVSLLSTSLNISLLIDFYDWVLMDFETVVLPCLSLFGGFLLPFAYCCTPTSNTLLPFKALSTAASAPSPSLKMTETCTTHACESNMLSHIHTHQISWPIMYMHIFRLKAKSMTCLMISHKAGSLDIFFMHNKAVNSLVHF